MKKFLLLILLALVGCCSASDSSTSDKEQLVKKFEVKYHHTENCGGHRTIFEKIDVEIDGHDFWYIWYSGSTEEGTFIHSPDCKKCHGSSNLSSDYKSMFDW